MMDHWLKAAFRLKNYRTRVPSVPQLWPHLCRFIGQHGSSAIFGLDFPFSLPRALLGENGWPTFVRSFANTYPDCESFRTLCHQKVSGCELKRRTDRETHTPFSVYNLRLYRQTYFGIRDVVAPLLGSGSAWFAPMERRVPAKPCVVEICPASTLKHLGLYRHWHYKGRSSEHCAARRAILCALEETRRIRFEDHDTREMMLSDVGGDALDSLVAALAIYGLHETPEILETDESDYLAEGRVYV